MLADIFTTYNSVDPPVHWENEPEDVEYIFPSEEFEGPIQNLFKPQETNKPDNSDNYNLLDILQDRFEPIHKDKKYYFLDMIDENGKINNSKGRLKFEQYYDEVEKENPEAKKYRKFLTKLAQQESGFNSYIQNKAGAPAYGYFQFMQDGKKYNNISNYAGTDIETFRNNPKLQIKAAIKLAKQFEKGFSQEDLSLAKQKGYSIWGLLGGAWLAGNGGVRRYLRDQGNPSDKHWDKKGKGTDVASRIKLFN